MVNAHSAAYIEAKTLYKPKVKKRLTKGKGIADFS